MPAPRTRRLLTAGLLVALALLAGGCLLPPEPVTDAGRDVFNLYVLVLILAGIVFVGVEGFILYAIVRYRRAPGDDILPEQHHGNTKVEILWTAIPTVLVLILFVMSVLTLGSVEARADRPGVTIVVEGFQWQWNFIYPDGTRRTGTAAEPAELAVPVNEPVRLELASLDVNHAFFVPEFLIKRDLIKMGENGKPNELEFTITEAGTYSGQCAEFCGVGHADMVFIVNAMPRADYDVYMAAIAAGESPPPPPGEGECAEPVQISADNLEFDTDQFEVPADTPFCIEFENLEAQSHNVAIYEQGDTPTTGDPLFQGKILAEPGTITYQVPALEAGDYDFFCDVHPEMTGVVVVSEQ